MDAKIRLAHRMWGQFVGSAMLALAIGCSSSSAPTVPNPFQTSDRVPPPPTHTAPLAPATPYYGAPGVTGGAPPAGAGKFPASPSYPSTYPAGGSPAFAPGPASTPYGTPPSAPLGQTPRGSEPLASRGDAVAVPGDAAPLRFGVASQPAPLSAVSTNQIAATANGWIAGSAPVRNRTSSNAVAPLARIPSGATGREPVSLAALGNGNGQVQITPLGPPNSGSGASVANAQSGAAAWR